MNMPDRRTRRQIPVAVLVLLATATLFMSSPSLAALRCPGAAEPAELTITPFFGKISYRMGNTRGDLKRIEQRHAGRGQGLPGNWFPLGLTLAQIGIRPSATFVIRTLRSGRICAFPQSITVEIGYPEFTIWVDRRYRRGTCEYQAILDHEQDHIRIYREQLRLFIDGFRQKIASVIRQQRPAFATSADIAVDQVKNQLFGRILPLRGELQRIADQANSAIDTAASYQAIQDLCRNW